MGRSQRQKGPGPRRATLGAQHGRKGQASDPGVPLTTPRAMSSILGTWLFQYPDDFHQPPEFPCLKTIVAYVELSMPGSDLEQQAHLLLAQLEQLELPEADSDGEQDAGWGIWWVGRGRHWTPQSRVWEDSLGVESGSES